ncbi:hypothetical protein GIB67_007405 [Kingdonia uniflora]|uniref:Uncharacterized protein n=1 Tax=Kingdonia uniflora TaxID=39325 RepID=A0A7J7MM08_9MAGN|nr:hypothetical protein GIB67_007405 [Kingdonia uniflora]
MEIQSVCLTNHFTPHQFRAPNVQLKRINHPNLSFSSNSRVRAIASANSSSKPNGSVYKYDRPEPFGGKSASVSFYGVTHQVMEEGKLISAPFNEEKSSFFWVLGPVALISSLVLPQFVLSSVAGVLLSDEIVAEIVVSITSETMFYFGLAAFLLVTDHVQRPYLQFSPKRWGLITGLKGYLTSAYCMMGFKVLAPLIAVFITWEVLGRASMVSVAPFLVGCAVQFVFEKFLNRRNSSSWPLVPIIFEVYRLYQLSKAAHFMERLMYSMRGSAAFPQLFGRSDALVLMLMTFQGLGIICLWSLLTFLLRLFPSRPVAENY